MWIFHAPPLHHIWRHPPGDFQHKRVHTLISAFQSFSTNAVHKTTAENAKKAGEEWEAPPSDVLEVLQWSVSTKMKDLYGFF